MEENLKIWCHTRYEGLIENKATNSSPNNILVLPGYIKLSKVSIENIINAFKKVSNMKDELL